MEQVVSDYFYIKSKKSAHTIQENGVMKLWTSYKEAFEALPDDTWEVVRCIIEVRPHQSDK